MLEQIKELPSKAINIIRGGDAHFDARSALKQIEQSLLKEWKAGLVLITGAPCLDPKQNDYLHAAIENLTECHTAVRILYKAACPVNPQHAANIIATQITNTKRFIESIGAGDDAAMNVAMKTLNMLFAAEQEIKNTFSLNGRRETTAVDVVATTTSRPVMTLSSSMMFQLWQALFPAERMMVGAGYRHGNNVTVNALFDVTGVAGTGGVKADPDLLGRALIAMSQSGSHFALWIHSHPGSGPEATRPSGIDIRQHADWLKNYSDDLVSAIMVKDAYFRFWGTAVESGKISISIDGDGVSGVSVQNHVYRLGV